MQYDDRDEQERGMRPRGEARMQQQRRGEIRMYGDTDWHRGVDAYGNPVFYRAYAWSYQYPGESWRREEEDEPQMHGRTQSRHYQRSDERIREDVYDRLNDHPNIDSHDLKATVSGGEVTLEGNVRTRREKRMAEDVAESVSGVRDVQNHLKVVHPAEANGHTGEEPSAKQGERPANGSETGRMSSGTSAAQSTGTTPERGQTSRQ